MYKSDKTFADYVLFVDKKPVGIIEAKKKDERYALTVAEDQATKYAKAKGLKYLDNDHFPRAIKVLNKLGAEFLFTHNIRLHLTKLGLV